MKTPPRKPEAVLRSMLGQLRLTERAFNMELPPWRKLLAEMGQALKVRKGERRG